MKHLIILGYHCYQINVTLMLCFSRNWYRTMNVKMLCVFGLMALLSGCVYEEFVDLELIDYAQVSYDVDSTSLIINTNLIYENDRKTLKPGALKVLRSLYRQVSNEFFTKLNVIAHCDDALTERTAAEVTTYQAQSVAGYFWFRGVDATEVFFEGKGFADPVSDMLTPLGVIENQRIEIRLT